MSYTHAGYYVEGLLSSVGTTSQFLRNIPVNVYAVGTSTPTTLYLDRNRTAGSNPVNSDANGNLVFYADPSQYDIVFTPPGGSLQRLTISVPPDPADLTLAASTRTLQQANNTATETVLTTYTINANSLLAGSVIRVRAGGNYDNQTTSGNITVQLKYGGTSGTSLSSAVFSNSTANTTASWFWDTDLVCLTTGASGTVVLQGHFEAGGVGGLRQPIPTGGTPVKTVDTTASNALVLTVTWTTQSVTNIWRQYSSTVEVL